MNSCLTLSPLVWMFLTAVFLQRNAVFGLKKTPLRIGSFNIRVFGEEKASNESTMAIITSILRQYDVVLIQEVHDKDLKILNNLIARLKATFSSVNWDYITSLPLGRTSFKEQYVFFYRTRYVRNLKPYQLPDTKDVFEREPFSVKLEYYSKESNRNRNVVFLALHTKPTDTPAELAALPGVIKHAKSTLGADVIAMGDFNADCRYLSEKKKKSLEIFTDKAFRSLINHTADTTVGNTECAYDRIIVSGRFVADMVHIYRFDEEMNLSKEEALQVSDHYPVQFRLW